MRIRYTVCTEPNSTRSRACREESHTWPSRLSPAAFLVGDGPDIETCETCSAIRERVIG